MPVPGFKDDGTMIADLAQFDVLHEIAEAERQKPWASGIHSRTLFKKPDLRVVLISMEAAARLKEHHADGASSLYMVKGHISATTRRGRHMTSAPGTCLLWAHPSNTASRL